MKLRKAFRIVALASMTLTAGWLFGAQESSDEPPAFRWLEPNRPAETVFHPTHQVDIVRLAGEFSTRTEVEEEVVQKGPNSRQLVRRVYDRDESGVRRLVQREEELLTSHPDGAQEAEMTISRLDPNGRFQVVEKRVQQTSVSGPDAFQTETTTYAPGAGGGLQPFEFIRQTERKRADRVEAEKTVYRYGGNRNWEPMERRQTIARSGASGEWSSQEEVFQRKHQVDLTLSETSSSREWKDDQGRVHRTTEFHLSDPSGRLSLDRRIRTVLEEVGEGATRVVQEVEQTNPAAPREGVQLVERLVESVEALPSGGERRRVEIQGRDGSGRLQPIATMEKTRQVQETPTGSQSRGRSELDRPDR